MNQRSSIALSVCIVLLFVLSAAASSYSNSLSSSTHQSNSQFTVVGSSPSASSSSQGANQVGTRNGGENQQSDPSSPWLMYKENPQLSGVTSTLGAQSNGQIWNYTFASTVLYASSPNRGGGTGTVATSPDGSAVYSEVDSDPNSLVAISATTGNLLWAFTNSSESYGGPSTPPAVGSDGTVYVGGDGGLYSINSSDGSENWWLNLGSTFGFVSAPIIGPDGTIYMYDNGGIAYAITPSGSGGTLDWSYNSTLDTCREFEGTQSSPSLSPDGGTLYVASTSSTGCDVGDEGVLDALNVTTGSLLWQYDAGASVSFSKASPVVGPDGTVYLSADDGEGVYAITLLPRVAPPPRFFGLMRLRP
jgi:outer membrane protein assembly factor BamB